MDLRWVQFIILLDEWHKAHRHTNMAQSQLLCILEALLPESHRMTTSFYQSRKFLRSSLRTQLDFNECKTVDICRNPKCDHLYMTYPGKADDACPREDCRTPRFECATGSADTRDPALCLHCYWDRSVHRCQLD
jgi:hypothetical protein